MRIVTWNVNSIGARTERVLDWCRTHQPDVVAMQELKCTTENFPAAEFQELGYEVAALGTGRWNGVAIISKVGITDVKENLLDQPVFEGAIEPRAIGATCGGVRVWSVYVPNGREVDHDHFNYKINWLNELKENAAAEKANSDLPYAIIGDFNVAPNDDDVWDIKDFENATHVTAEERKAVLQLNEIGLQEIMPRSLKGKPFTYWDYRSLMFQKGQGMRIDLVYANAAFAKLSKDVWIDRDERKVKGGSDHAPVVIDLNL
ncbi:MAG: Exodeoxyribonuclease [Actinomycetota bacterium]|jgi:exodeoxyribonuclease-3